MPQIESVEENDVLRATADWPDNPEESIRLLESFLESHPQSVSIKLRLAVIYSGAYGDGVEGAGRLYREILSSEPNNVFALSGLGLLQGSPGSTLSGDESLGLLRRAAGISDETWVLENLANKAWDVGRFSEALVGFQKLLLRARTMKQPHLATRAKSSIKALRQGKLGNVTGYQLPDVCDFHRSGGQDR
jgi:hypothetical protein